MKPRTGPASPTLLLLLRIVILHLSFAARQPHARERGLHLALS
jgi:hypothetical protein